MLNFEQILNRTESLNVSKTYNYIEQKSLFGKPSIISGDETLKKYPLTIKLHHSFCNPQKVIDEIEQKAKKREIINYFQNGRYIGNYVINNYKINIKQKIDDAITFAEIKIELLEYPQSSLFKHQSNKTPDILSQIYAQNSITVKKFLNNARRQILLNIFSSLIAKIQTQTISTLSAATNLLLQKLKIAAINEIQIQGLSNAPKIIAKYTKNLNLINKEKLIVLEEMNKLTNELTNAALRIV